MDAIESLGDEIQKQAFISAQKASGAQVDCIFFDVTTLYFESTVQDEIKEFGFSKDQKHHQIQIVLALVVDSNGLPIAYDVFKGNLAETKTLIPVLEGLRSRFSIKNVAVICDRGMASKANVEALQGAAFQFVIATKLRGMSKSLKINDLSTYSDLYQQGLSEEDDKVLVRTMAHPQYKDTLLIATHSSARARKDKDDRDRLIEKLRKKLSGDDDGASIKKIISNSGYKKFTDVQEGSSVRIDEEAIDEDTLWDGFHGIAVSNGSKMSVNEALSRYRDLWRIEEAFRVAKCTLRARPIFHWTPHRIRSHILLCFMNLFLERFLELLLRRNETNLTPDRIRYALAQIHTIFFDDSSEESEGKMPSALTKDAEQIFRVLGITNERHTTMGPNVVPEFFLHK
jgi:transposase